MINFKPILLSFLLLLIGSISITSGPVLAQTSDAGSENVAVPEALSPEAMSALVSKLDPEQTEALTKLMELLSSSVAEGPDPDAVERSRMLATLKTRFADFGTAVGSHIRNLPEAVAAGAAAFWAPFDGRGFGGSMVFLGLLALVVAIGVAAELLFNRVLGGWRSNIRSAQPDTLLETLKVLSCRALIQIGGLIAFTVAALVAARVIYGDESDRFVATTFILQAILLARFTAAVMRFLLAPGRRELRLVSTGDETANYIYHSLVSIAAVIGVALFMVALMEHYDIGPVNALRFWLGMIITGWIMWVTWRARDGLTSIIKGDEEELTPGLERMATWWPGIAVVIMALDWLSIQFSLSAGEETITPGQSVASMSLIVMAPFLDTMVRGISAHLAPKMEGEGSVAEKANHETRMCYVRMGRIILIAALILLFGELRGISLYNLTETGLGDQIASNSVGFLLILAAGYMAWEITNFWVNRRLARELPETEGSDDGGEAGGTGLSRMATILPIVRMTLQATIITITVLLALSQLGVNITPLLAGAGVLGLAIGFGAQTLVKDVVSGVFFLLDDAFRVGEYVDVGGTDGTVEKIMIRSLQLRGCNRAGTHCALWFDLQTHQHEPGLGDHEAQVHRTVRYRSGQGTQNLQEDRSAAPGNAGVCRRHSGAIQITGRGRCD